MTDWATLFERAGAFEVTEAEVRAALSDRRDAAGGGRNAASDG